MKQRTNPKRNVERRARRTAKRLRTTLAQMLKPSRERKHVQHQHELRDVNGAYTLVGSNPYSKRRMWLAGVSAQRGY